MLDAAGIEQPSLLEGRSLLTDEYQDNRYIFSEVEHMHHPVKRFSVRYKNHALLHTLVGWDDEPEPPEGGSWEFYDHISDPDEHKNLPLDSTAMRMQKILLAQENAANGTKPDPQQDQNLENIDEDLLENLKTLGYL